MNTNLLLIILMASIAYSCLVPEKKHNEQKEQLVLITTKYGDIKIKLYDETPLHKQNFIKLVNEGYYNDLLFHRVIKDFMIQGGDPDSRNAPADKELGNGGPAYTIPAEFVPSLFHKKGVLAAAREGDNINPSKASSGSQFYIVQGKKFSDADIDNMENQVNQARKGDYYRKYLTSPENIAVKNKIDSLRNAGDMNTLREYAKIIEPVIDLEFNKLPLFKYSEKQRNTYKTVGGTPHLDGNYTVFGEVVEGLNVVDSIAYVKTGKNDRPLEDLKMTIKLIYK